MPKNDAADCAGRLLVLDLETLPDPKATAIAPRGREVSRAALHRIAAYSSLSAVEEADGKWSGFSLRSMADVDEFDLLMDVDGALSDLVEAEGALVTYNGASHDLAILRRRAAAHWMFGLPGLGHLDDLAHRDLLRIHAKGRRDRMPTLRDACAGYGIPTDHMLVDRYGGPPRPVCAQPTSYRSSVIVFVRQAVQERWEKFDILGWLYAKELRSLAGGLEEVEFCRCRLSSARGGLPPDGWCDDRTDPDLEESCDDCGTLLPA